MVLMKPSPSQKIKERTLTGLDTIHERMKDLEGPYVSYAGFFEFTGGRARQICSPLKHV